MSTRALLLASGLAALLTACGGDEGPTWRPVAEDALAPAERAQRDRGLAARDALASRLLGALTEAFEQKGPAAAIEVCREAAPRIAAEVARDEGVAIGRTSKRLRSTANAAPAWANANVASEADEPIWYASKNGALRGLLPIRMQQRCTTCHGDAAQIPEDVRAALARLYPEDRATGFSLGELRGWFWLEVPPAGP